MALCSMTGFGRADGENARWRWAWEVRSVNGRGLDIRTRLPVPFDSLETDVRAVIQKQLKRGSVSVALSFQRLTGVSGIAVNEDVLQSVLAAAERITERHNAAPPTVDGLLALKGVLEPTEQTETEEQQAATRAEILKSLDAALAQLLTARQTEGAKLAAILGEKIEKISALTQTIAQSPARQPEAMKARIKDQVARLMEPGDGLDETRLHQEAVLLATRADIEEEIKRLEAHVTAANALLKDKAPIGRQLDFLAQEFNREANTICSKAPSNDISQAGLQLKTAIDQLREQVQNVE